MPQGVSGDSPSSAVENEVVLDAAPPAGATPAAESTTPDVTAESSTATADPAPSAGAKTDDKPAVPASTLDIVRSAVKKDSKPVPSTEQAKPAAESETPEAKAKREKDEESRLDKQPGFQRVLRERNEARAAIEQFKPDAERYRETREFMSKHQLDDRNFKDLLDFGALLRSDPEKARARMLVELAELDEILGHKLPSELQAKVDEGLLTHEDALELSRTRATAARAQAEVSTVREAQTAEQQQRVQQEFVANVDKAIKAWDANTAASDPHFEQKKPLVHDRVRAVLADMRAQGKQITPADVPAILTQAHKFITEQTRAMLPPKSSVKAPLDATAAPATRAAPTGGSTLDIVRASYRNRGAA